MPELSQAPASCRQLVDGSAQGHRAPSVRTDLRALAAVTAIVAFELLTSYAEDTEQGMWPLLNQLEHSLPTILTSCFRIV